MTGPSHTTQQLIDMLLSRDAAGRAKYGTSLDRTDLSADEWAQHMLEELLDAAGYLVRLRERIAANCRCVDCGGDQPKHDPGCAYMLGLYGRSP